jgi:lysophospholipase L1-like esterase
VTEEHGFDSIEFMENIQAPFDHLIRENPMGEGKKDALRVKCDVFSITMVSLVLLVLNFGCTSNRSNLWILSGQSNACGRGLLPGPKAIDKVRMFAPDEGKFDPGPGEWETAEDPLPGMETRGVSAWVTAAQTVAQKGYKIDMLGYALGAQPISHWAPGGEGERKLFARIEEAGKGAGVFLWYQGESDTKSSEDAAAYQDRLTDLVARVRKAAENPHMTAVIIQLCAKTRPGEAKGQAYFMQVREAQRQFVLADGNALLVTALGRLQKDDGHLSTPGYMELGEELARALLRNRFNQTDINWPGPVLDSAVLQPDSRKVTAHFAEVKELAGVAESDFVVVDAEGSAVCSAARAGVTTLELTFDRQITLPARFFYAYADSPEATLVDEAGNRAPAVQIDVTTGSPPADEFTNAPNGAGPS